MLERSIGEEELRSESPGGRKGIVQSSKLGYETRSLGHDVGVEQENQAPASNCDSDVGRRREPAVATTPHDAKWDAE